LLLRDSPKEFAIQISQHIDKGTTPSMTPIVLSRSWLVIFFFISSVNFFSSAAFAAFSVSSPEGQAIHQRVMQMQQMQNTFMAQRPPETIINENKTKTKTLSKKVRGKLDGKGQNIL
jgi:hypothetical protein